MLGRNTKTAHKIKGQCQMLSKSNVKVKVNVELYSTSSWTHV